MILKLLLILTMSHLSEVLVVPAPQRGIRRGILTDALFILAS